MNTKEFGATPQDYFHVTENVILLQKTETAEQ